MRGILIFLLRIGNRIEVTYTNDHVQMPDEIVIEYEPKNSIDTLIEHVFLDLEKNWTYASYMRERAILSLRNSMLMD